MKKLIGAVIGLAVAACTSTGPTGSSGGSSGASTTAAGTTGGASTGGGSTTGGATTGATTSTTTGGNTGLPVIGGCQIFPADNPWNRDITNDPLDPNSDNYMAYMTQGGANVHPDFGSDPTYGIPYVVVPASQPKVPIQFLYSDSDPGPYPIPPNPPIEAGSDRHILVLENGSCTLYEVGSAQMMTIGGQAGWACNAGAIFHLGSNQLRTDCATSADAAGLPILPGLVRYAEATSGAYHHAVRFTMANTQQAFIHPATHYASGITDTNAPPMGLRLRLKASFDLSSYTGSALAVATALKHYGMLLADNGSDFYLSGETNTSWDDNDLNQLKQIPGSAFEVVQSGTVVLPASCP